MTNEEQAARVVKLLNNFPGVAKVKSLLDGQIATWANVDKSTVVNVTEKQFSIAMESYHSTMHSLNVAIASEVEAARKPNHFIYVTYRKPEIVESEALNVMVISVSVTAIPELDALFLG